MSAFSTALSGLSANSTALEVVGNNLANLNTAGYKSSEVLFKDVMADSSRTAAVGSGVAPPYTNRQFAQGSLQSTSGIFDVGIQGGGLFVLQSPSGQALYTRDGSFKIDRSGLLVTATGEMVQGWTAVNGVVVASGPVSNLSVANLAPQAPSATTAMTLNANLNAAAAVGDTFSTAIQVVDSLGVTHNLTEKFTKTAANAWSYDVSIPGQDVTGGTPGTQTSLATGSLTFNSSGNLTSPAAGAPVNVATTTGLTSGAANLNITWSLYDPSGNALLTQYAQTSAASASSQNGVQPADVIGVKLTDGGTLVATYSNGKQITLAQVALAAIGNPESLVSAGKNNYQLGPNTLTPSVGAPGTGPRGQIVGGSLEGSNVDLAREFTNLIIYQRGYQANSKAITTQDQITQVLMNMK